jgi:MoaA/NifB/PqqE/SkfB family radical SAM enzyme
MRKVKERLDRLQFEIHIVEHCNLNCQMCDHFSPLARPEFLKIETFEKDLVRLSKLFNADATYIRLLGGEPLLNSNAPDFFVTARKHFPYTSIELYTNGLLLPKQNQKFWDICRTEKISIVVTRYPISHDYSVAERIAQKEMVSLSYSQAEMIKTSWHLPICAKGDMNAEDNFMECDMGNSCIFLRNGRLYACTVIPNIHHFNEYFSMDIQPSHTDSIDIYSTDNPAEILDVLRRPIQFCRYCNTKKRTTNLLWKPSCKSISEWT